MKLPKLRIIESFDGEKIVPVIVLSERWCKPLSELGKTFDDIMWDSNKSIKQALWRRDDGLEGVTLGWFDPKEELSSFDQKSLYQFILKEAVREIENRLSGCGYGDPLQEFWEERLEETVFKLNNL